VRLLERREDLSVLTSSVTSRTLSRLGIRLFDLAFQSQAFQDLYRRLVKGNIRVNANPKVLVKYDPDNLMTFYVEDAQNKVFLPSNCPVPRLCERAFSLEAQEGQQLFGDGFRYVLRREALLGETRALGGCGTSSR